MARSKLPQSFEPRGKRQKFKVEHFVRSRVEGERTFFNLDVMGRSYKLERAYRSVRNLEFRADRRITVQTFRDYLTQYGDTFKPVFNFVEKPRPCVSS